MSESASITKAGTADNPFPESIYKRILFCTDFSENADHAFGLAIDAAIRQPGSTLFILHVIPEPEGQFWKTYIYEIEGIDDKAKHDIDEKIARDYLSRVPAGVQAQLAVRIGKDYLQILEFAEENDVDVIVMGRAGRTGSLAKLFFGSVIEHVVRHAPCPVLVVPHPRNP